MNLSSFFRKPILNGMVFGVLGGITLIGIASLSTSGFIQILPYPLALIAALLTLKYSRNPSAGLSSYFIAGLITFVTMSVFVYLQAVLFANPHNGISFIGHLWRFAVIVAIGSACSLLLSLLARPIEQRV